MSFGKEKTVCEKPITDVIKMLCLVVIVYLQLFIILQKVVLNHVSKKQNEMVNL
jgi:hypothetical protein